MPDGIIDLFFKFREGFVCCVETGKAKAELVDLGDYESGVFIKEDDLNDSEENL